MDKRNACDNKASFHASLTPRVDVWRHSLMIHQSFFVGQSTWFESSKTYQQGGYVICHLNA